MSRILKHLARRGAIVLTGAALLCTLAAAALVFAADAPPSATATAARTSGPFAQRVLAASSVAHTVQAAASPVSAASASIQAQTVSRTITKPNIVWKPVPFGAKRKAEISAYCKRHYGVSGWRLTPRVIVLHFTAGADWRAAWNYFSSDTADPEFHELPGPSSHFIIAKNGTIYQLVGTGIRSRHTYGLNHVAIGIEFAQECPSSSSWADKQILNRPAQINAGLRLVRWLQAKYKISMVNVIGHSMARSSRYYKDLVRPNTPDHGDWQIADVKVFRARLKQLH